MSQRPQIRSIVWVISGAVAAGAVSATSATNPEWTVVLQFLIAVLIVDLFDIWLPHGDAIGVDAALLVAAVVFLGPLAAALLSALARLTAYSLREKRLSLDKMMEVVGRRWIAVGSTGAVALALGVKPGAELTGVFTLNGILIGVTFLLSDFLLLQVQSSMWMQQGLRQLVAGNLTLQWPILASQVSIALLTLVVYPDMRAWGLSLMMLLLIVMRQSFALLVDVRTTYQQTMQALARAIEAQDPERRGHAERVAERSRAAGIRLGMYGRSLERLGYAALLHDVDLVGRDEPAIRVRSTELESERHASDILRDVKFLSDIVPILAVCDGRPVDSAASHDIDHAIIIAAASDQDEGIDVYRSRGPALARLSTVIDVERIEGLLASRPLSR